MSIAKVSPIAASTAPMRRAGDVLAAKVPNTALVPLTPAGRPCPLRGA